MQDFALCLSSSSASARLVSHFLVLSWLSHLKLTYNHISHCPALRTRLPTAHARQRPASCSRSIPPSSLSCFKAGQQHRLHPFAQPPPLPNILHVHQRNVFVFVFVLLLHVASSIRLWAWHICMRHPPSPEKKRTRNN